MLGADTRSTNGDTVADKNCEKIHYIAPNIYCCGAGTAADTEAVTGKCAFLCLVVPDFRLSQEWFHRLWSFTATLLAAPAAW